MARFEFEWAISAPDEHGIIVVRERLIGYDGTNFYKVPNQPSAEAVVKARRIYVNKITTKAGAMQIFEPRMSLLPGGAK